MIALVTMIIERSDQGDGYKQYMGCESVNSYAVTPKGSRVWYCCKTGCLRHVPAAMVERAASPVLCTEHR